MVGGNLDEDDPNATRILDPHLDQSLRLRYWLPEDPHACRRQPVMLGMDIPRLEPDHHGRV